MNIEPTMVYETTFFHQFIKNLFPFSQRVFRLIFLAKLGHFDKQPGRKTWSCRISDEILKFKGNNTNCSINKLVHGHMI